MLIVTSFIAHVDDRNGNRSTYKGLNFGSQYHCQTDFFIPDPYYVKILGS